MTRVFDTFMVNDELDMLECRLTELDSAPIYRWVIVEAMHTHRGKRKPLYYLENRERFAPWRDRITHVIASSLPDSADPWVREHAQREYAREGLTTAEPGDAVLHGDVDEIPTVAAVEAVAELPAAVLGPMVFLQRHYMYAVDWQYPALVWPGTIAARWRDVQGFQWLRSQRFMLPTMPGAGWHLSWMGGPVAHNRKLGQHCHLEMTAEEAERISSGRAYREGVNHGGAQMIPVDVDETWPRWVAERKCPPSWFRPREDAAVSA